ncbi:MAG: hypothetical protein U5K84_10510 [Alkalibacterium sp.]|nr:hypothetical protein [Alkalibacterium sp.]
MEKIKVQNPIIPLDYPDPDVIRVGESLLYGIDDDAFLSGM